MEPIINSTSRVGLPGLEMSRGERGKEQYGSLSQAKKNDHSRNMSVSVEPLDGESRCNKISMGIVW